MPLDLLQLCARALDGIPDHAAVQFDLPLARPATRADSTLLPFQVAPAAHQTRTEVLQPRQFNLEFAFMAAGPLGKNLQDQHGAVVDRQLEKTLQIALLRRTQGLVKQNFSCSMCSGQLPDFFSLSATHKQGSIRRLTLAGDARHRLQPGSLRQQTKLFQLAVKMWLTQIDTNQYGVRHEIGGVCKISQ